MSVIRLHPDSQVAIIFRDRSERHLDVLPEMSFGGEELSDLGFRLCDACGSWCQPVRVHPGVGCGRCEFAALEAELTRGVHFHEDPRELAERVYRKFLAPAPEPARAS